MRPSMDPQPSPTLPPVQRAKHRSHTAAATALLVSSALLPSGTTSTWRSEKRCLSCAAASSSTLPAAWMVMVTMPFCRASESSTLTKGRETPSAFAISFCVMFCS